jgi:hypothetical protein
MAYTRTELEVVLADELKLLWVHDDDPTAAVYSKRSLIGAYTSGWSLPQLIGLARRVEAEFDVPTAALSALLVEHDRVGGVAGLAKNLIFAANGPKPELVLRDAVNNDVEIVKNAEYCLIFDQPLPADGLTFKHLIDWWRIHEQLGTADDRTVGLSVHARLASSLNGNSGEQLVFDAYSRRYREHGFNVPALLPQVYLHYDPYTARARGSQDGPLTRQRMDFLLLVSNRRRIVIEVDGKQHYADETGRADPARYARMVAEDRRIRLAGYEIYRFGGKELTDPGAAEAVTTFFDVLLS